MSFKLGSTSIGDIYLGSTKVAEAYLGNIKVYSSADPLNPLGLPPFTIRCQFSSGYTPTMGDSRTLVDASSNVWDIYRDDTDWAGFLSNDDPVSHLTHVLGANTTGVTDMGDLFSYCDTLVSVCLFDTSACENMENMFMDCRALTSIPLFDTSNVDNMSYAFVNCREVQSGALALYQQASTQTTPPASHKGTFQSCGSLTDTGRAELNQIPTDWGGNYEPDD